MDQRTLAGLGNIHVSESLFRARIDPQRPGVSMTREEVERLADCIVDSLRSTLSEEDGPEPITYVEEGGENVFSSTIAKGSPVRTAAPPSAASCKAAAAPSTVRHASRRGASVRCGGRGPRGALPAPTWPASRRSRGRPSAGSTPWAAAARLRARARAGRERALCLPSFRAVPNLTGC